MAWRLELWLGIWKGIKNVKCHDIWKLQELRLRTLDFFFFHFSTIFNTYLCIITPIGIP